MLQNMGQVSQAQETIWAKALERQHRGWLSGTLGCHAFCFLICWNASMIPTLWSCENVRQCVKQSFLLWSVQGDFGIPRTGSWWSGQMNHQAGDLDNWIGDAFYLPRNEVLAESLLLACFKWTRCYFGDEQKTFSWHWQHREEKIKTKRKEYWFNPDQE